MSRAAILLRNQVLALAVGLGAAVGATSRALAAPPLLRPLRDEIAARIAAAPPKPTRHERGDFRVLRAASRVVERESTSLDTDLRIARRVVAPVERRFARDVTFVPALDGALAALGRQVDDELAATRAAAAVAPVVGDAAPVTRRLADADRLRALAAAAPSRARALRRLAAAARAARRAAAALVPAALTTEEALAEPRTSIVAGAITESSGLAFAGGAFWTHGDSGTPASLFRSTRLDFADAQALAVPGVTNTDWEDLAVAGDDVVVCDIGDNGRVRADIAAHRVRYVAATATEPARLDLVATWPLAYPDGPHDAEAAWFSGDALHVVVKRRGEETTNVFRFAALVTADDLPPGERNVAEPAATLDLTAIDFVTAADIHPARGEVALLTYTRLVVYRSDAVSGAPLRSVPLSLTLPPHQYESATFAGGWLVVGAESGALFAVDAFSARR